MKRVNFLFPTLTNNKIENTYECNALVKIHRYLYQLEINLDEVKTAP